LGFEVGKTLWLGNDVDCDAGYVDECSLCVDYECLMNDLSMMRMIRKVQILQYIVLFSL
jgi:hypothetical protein